MKTNERWGKTTTTLIIEKNKDEYWVSVKELPGCYSVGSTIEEAISNTREAISEHISDLPEGSQVPEIFLNKDLVFQIQYDIQTLFERFKMLNKSAIAEHAGINPSLLRQYSNGLAYASEKQKAKIEAAIHEIGIGLLEASL
jgi:predicted RNase H-like HicB family nuclease